MNFLNEKKMAMEKLQGFDKSVRGKVDYDIKELVNLFNSKDNYYTTSSCSGRIVLISIPKSGRKEDTRWLFVSHDVLSDLDSIKSSIRSADVSDPVWLLSEPFILHIACNGLEAAKELIKCAQVSGLKRSCLINVNRFIVEIVGSDILHAPLLKDNIRLGNGFDENYLDFLLSQANDKLRKTKKRLVAFTNQISSYNL